MIAQDALAGGPLDAGARRFDVFTGAGIADGGGAADVGGAADGGDEPDGPGAADADVLAAALREGLAPPRYCGACGRRMVVQVRPDGWWARCSRHGQIDSSALDQR